MPAIVLETPTRPSRFAHFYKVHNPLPLTHKTTSERPRVRSKVLRTRHFFALLTSKCASRHNSMHFFDMSTSKSAPRPSVFNTFEFEMCFAPQQRTLFRHVNFQKCSSTGVFCTFLLRNVLRATTACTFSTSQLPKVLRDRQFLTLLTSKRALRHNGVHFFDMSTSKSAPTLEYFVHFYLEMCFAPQRRAFFRHLNFQKCSERFTWKCASRHNGVQLFISHLARWLRTRRFSAPEP